MNRNHLDKVIVLGSKIAELRQQLQAAESELAVLVVEEKGSAPAKSSPARAAPAIPGTTLTSRILQYLAQNRDRPHPAAEITKALGDAKLNSVRTFLRRLEARKDVRRIARRGFVAV